MNVEKPLMTAILDAPHTPPADYVDQLGWVLIAFQNALWQLLNAPSLEEGVVDTVMRGGDTDTNAAIAGALLGAVYGRNALPKQWIEKILSCRPREGEPAYAGRVRSVSGRSMPLYSPRACLPGLTRGPTKFGESGDEPEYFCDISMPAIPRNTGGQR
jgi:hypothetical protein